ncbi:YDG domain-containing protein, partial [Hydromonas duriensis]|uniref:YDG domain-containing protein n=1 Tax=Hydromonas duriensis TaxID=1527608 RepID=UPI001FEC9A82
ADAVSITGLVAGDTVTGLSQSYDNKNAGSGKTVSVDSGYTIGDGNGGQNYSVSTQSATNGVIDKASLTLSASNQHKTYDGTTSAADAVSITGLVAGDTVTGLSQSYDNKNAGSGKTVSVDSGYTIGDGNGGQNYSVSTQSATNGVIDPRKLKAISALVRDRYYDGTARAKVEGVVLSGLIDGETLVVESNASFSNALIGKNKPVTVTYSLFDSKNNGLKNNYSLDATEIVSASILPNLNPVNSQKISFKPDRLVLNKFAVKDIKLENNSTCSKENPEKCFCEDTSIDLVQVCYFVADKIDK